MPSLRLLVGMAPWLGAALGLAVALGPADASAQNLLFNGDFPEVLGLNGWEHGSGSASWSTFERGLSASWLGSAHITGNGSYIGQCVPAFAGEAYRLSGWAYLDNGTNAALRLRFVEGTCNSWVTISTEQVGSAALDEWVFLDVTSVAPPGSVAVRAELYTSTSVSGGASGYFDNIVLPEPTSVGTGAALFVLAGLHHLRRRTAC